MSLKILNKKVFIILGTALVFCIFTFVILWSRQQKLNQSRMNECMVDATNKSLPEGKFVDAKSGIDLFEDVKTGKVLLILITTECGSCQKEVQIISENATLINQKIKVFAVSIESKTKTQEFTEKYNLKFPVLIDEERKLFGQLQVKCTPTNLFIENGVIKNSLIGSPKDLEDLMKNL